MGKTSKLEELIEKYRFWIGGILILAIVCGSAVLIWRENYAKPRLEDRIAGLEDKIGDLETDINNQETINNNQLITNDQNSNNQTEQGQVAGAGSQNTAGQIADNSKKATAAQTTSGKININTATAAELDASLPGIGPAYAGRIVDYRTANGGFKSIDEIKNVKGIGEKTFDKFKDQIVVN